MSVFIIMMMMMVMMAVMMVEVVMIILINLADPGCQEEEDLGLRYAGTASHTVDGWFGQKLYNKADEVDKI